MTTRSATSRCATSWIAPSRSLSHDHRVVVVLHHFVGLPLGEIADVLGIPYGTVGTRLYHAMRSMRATIDAAERTTVRGGQPA